MNAIQRAEWTNRLLQYVETLPETPEKGCRPPVICYRYQLTTESGCSDIPHDRCGHSSEPLGLTQERYDHLRMLTTFNSFASLAFHAPTMAPRHTHLGNVHRKQKSS